MTINLPKLRRILTQAKVVQIVQGFQETLTVTSPTSKSDQVRQRIEDRICGNSARSITGLTPTIASSVLFTRSSGVVKNSVAFEGFWRGVEVSVANFSPSDTGRGNSNAPYDLSVYVEVSYPDQRSVLVGSQVLDVNKIKSEDNELIDRLMRGGDLLTNPSAIADAQVVALTGAYDIGNTIVRHNYAIHIKRTF